MGNLFRLFAKKDRIKLTRDASGDWMVKKNLQILYIGSKEKCQTYMNQMQLI